jgi:hypothetical protein
MEPLPGVVILRARSAAYGFRNDDLDELIRLIALREGQAGHAVFIDRAAMAGPIPIPAETLTWAISFHVPWDTLIGAGAEVLMAAILQWMLTQGLRIREGDKGYTEEETIHTISRRIAIIGPDGVELGAIEHEETEEVITIRKKIRK